MATACRYNAHRLRCEGVHDLSVTVNQVAECACIGYNTIVPTKFLLPKVQSISELCRCMHHSPGM